MKISRIGLTANIYKEGISQAIKEVIASIPSGIELVCMEELKGFGVEPRVGIAEGFAGCDVVIAIGGDGTLLRASRMVEESETPLLGIKMQSLGFLTEDDPKKAVSDLLEGRIIIQERMRLSISCETPEGDAQTFTALNDVVLHGVGVSRVLHLRTMVDGVTLGEYLSDGVIISTPTGSTAYSLAAGGPIINPVTMKAIIVTPLCPHSLSVRPVVVSDEETVVIDIVEEGQETMLTVDGQQSCRIKPGDIVSVRKSERVTRLVTCADYEYYDLVRRKLRWGGVHRRN
ncbi:MAG TPA: NAD(+)/NADH kinase [Candidatus Krumholzibacterium sp.]|nr:NAD(+)/NADH kinase [Candidatus Krumholzibacterium sp.]